MSSNRRPIAVLLVSCLYWPWEPSRLPSTWARSDNPATGQLWDGNDRIAGSIAGALMFRGRNWARWLALVWMAFHVAISFPALREVLTHSVVFALIAWALFRPERGRYFTPPKRHVE